MIKIIEVLGEQDNSLDYGFILDEGILKYQQRIQDKFTGVRNKMFEMFSRVSP